MKAVVAAGAGPPSVLRWADVDDDPRAGPGQLLLAVRATSVNRADVLQRLGRYPPPPGVTAIPGLEAAGEVLEVGAGVATFRPGDLAMALLAGGGHAERVAVDARHALPVPRAVGLPAAGGLMETFVTAWLNLAEVGRLVAGERVLVHGGAGGVGTAALQVARLLGAEVWATAGTPEKLALCRALGAREALDHRAEDFAARLRAAGGAHVVLDVMGARYLAKNLEALADDGRLVVIGLQGGVEGALPLGALLARRLSVHGSTLRALPAERKAALVSRAGAHLLPAFEDGRLRVVVDRVLPIERVAEAHALVEEYRNLGKIVLGVAPGAAAGTTGA